MSPFCPQDFKSLVTQDVQIYFCKLGTFEFYIIWRFIYNFREVTDDIIKEWLEFREETAFCNMTPQDKKYCIYFDELAEKIMNNVPKQNKKYVQKQLDQLDKNFMDYLSYWNEKYYRNGFVDGSQLVMGCSEK